MISNKINNITDWMNEGKIKNTKYHSLHQIMENL